MTLVCFAVEQEAAPFVRLSSRCAGVTVLVTGMGRAASEKAIASAFGEGTPELVLTCGFAGGLNRALRIGQVLYSADPIPLLVSRLENAGARPAAFLCSTTVLTTATMKAAARRDSGADAVEMESEWIRAFCRNKGVASATVRVVLDEAGADLPLDFNSVMSEDNRIAPSRLLGAIARKPRLIADLLLLGRHSRQAATALGEVLWRATGTEL